MWGRTEIHEGFWWANPKERENFKNLGVDFLG
jgi:hypothetical protein